MNRRIKTRFVKELRSGKYKRITGKLRGEKNCRCAGGVLCDMFVRSTVGREFAKEWAQEGSINGEPNGIPNEVCLWAEFDMNSWKIVRGVDVYSDADFIVTLNDDICPAERKGFKFVADMVEKYL